MGAGLALEFPDRVMLLLRLASPSFLGLAGAILGPLGSSFGLAGSLFISIFKLLP